MSIYKPITYKEVLDSEGNFIGLEIWQMDQHITITFARGGTHDDYSSWQYVKKIIDNISDSVRKDSE